MQSYRELKVWQDSFAVTKEVYILTSSFPNSEKFGLASQLQRCAVAVPSNIAEGQQRSSSKEFKQFLGIARGSAAELSTQLLLAQEIYKIDSSQLVSKNGGNTENALLSTK